MSTWLGIIQQGFFFGSIIVALTACAISLIYFVMKSRLRMLGAQTQASIMLGLCAAPVVVTLIVLGAALLPSFMQLLGIESDHCLGHTDGHRHFCLIHRPTTLDSQPLTLLASTFCLLLLLVGSRVIVDVAKTRKFRAMLNTYRVVADGGAMRILATEIPLAFTTGILRPRIFLSTGLLQNLSAEERALVVAHEKAHLRRCDSLRWSIARAFALAHFPYTRKSLLAHLYLASEQACDEAAAKQAQSPTKMAELLLKVERLYQPYFPAQAPLALSVQGNNGSMLPERVHALLSSTAPIQMPRATLVSTLFILMAAVVGHVFLHEGLEHMLELFQR